MANPFHACSQYKENIKKKLKKQHSKKFLNNQESYCILVVNMPLREFGGRAAGGALGLQHGNVLTDALGNITVVFPVAFDAVPDVVAVVLDAANNYKVTVRTVNALGFTGHVRQITTHTHTNPNTGAGSAHAHTNPNTGSSTVTMNAVADNGIHLGLGVGTIGSNLALGNNYPIEGSGHTHTEGNTGNESAHTHTEGNANPTDASVAAGAGVIVMWVAVS